MSASCRLFVLGDQQSIRAINPSTKFARKPHYMRAIRNKVMRKVS